MSRTLPLAASLLARARHLADLGRTADARATLRQLLKLAELPADTAVAARRAFAELLTHAGRFGRARRHLRAALKLGANDAETYFRLGAAFEQDANGDSRKALAAYRKATRIDATNANYLAAAGRVAVKLGRPKTGVAMLNRATELAKDDLAVLGAVADGLTDAGRTDDARELILAARFRHPRDARYLALWQTLQFRQARDAQLATRIAKRRTAAVTGEPTVLPFVRLVPAAPGQVTAGGVIRHDTGRKAPVPHLHRLPTRRIDTRRLP
jgi:tetratricopeptide (TPR) repeat protein